MKVFKKKNFFKRRKERLDKKRNQKSGNKSSRVVKSKMKPGNARIKTPLPTTVVNVPQQSQSSASQPSINLADDLAQSGVQTSPQQQQPDMVAKANSYKDKMADYIANPKVKTVGFTLFGAGILTLLYRVFSSNNQDSVQQQLIEQEGPVSRYDWDSLWDKWDGKDHHKPNINNQRPPTPTTTGGGWDAYFEAEKRGERIQEYLDSIAKYEERRDVQFKFDDPDSLNYRLYMRSPLRPLQGQEEALAFVSDLLEHGFTAYKDGPSLKLAGSPIYRLIKNSDIDQYDGRGHDRSVLVVISVKDGQLMFESFRGTLDYHGTPEQDWTVMDRRLFSGLENWAWHSNSIYGEVYGPQNKITRQYDPDKMSKIQPLVSYLESENFMDISDTEFSFERDSVAFLVTKRSNREVLGRFAKANREQGEDYIFMAIVTILDMDPNNEHDYMFGPDQIDTYYNLGRKENTLMIIVEWYHNTQSQEPYVINDESYTDIDDAIEAIDIPILKESVDSDQILSQLFLAQQQASTQQGFQQVSTQGFQQTPMPPQLGQQDSTQQSMNFEQTVPDIRFDLDF